MKIDTFYDFQTKLVILKKSAINNLEDKTEDFEIDDVYFIALSLPSYKPNNCIAVIGKEGRHQFETIVLPVTFDICNNIEPIHQLFVAKSRISQIPSGTRGSIKIKKYNIKIIASIFKEESNEPNIKVQSATEINENDTSEKLAIKKQAIEIIKKYPQMAGFLGIYGLNIPIIIDSDITLERLKHETGFIQEHVGIDLESTIGVKVRPINLIEENIPQMIIPVTLGKDKAFYVFENLLKNTFSIFNSSTVKIGGYTFYSPTKKIVCIIKEPSVYLNKKNVKAAATFITEKNFDFYKDIIITLIKAEPLTANEFFESSGLNFDYLDRALKIYGYFIKRGFNITNANNLKLITESRLDITDETTRAGLLVSLDIASLYNDVPQTNYNRFLTLMKEIVTQENGTSGTKKYKDEELIKEKLFDDFGINKPNAEHILRDILVENGYMRYDIETRNYTLDSKILELFNMKFWQMITWQVI